MQKKEGVRRKNAEEGGSKEEKMQKWGICRSGGVRSKMQK
jgi:hypothetical protein